MTKTFCDGCGKEINKNNSYDVSIDGRCFSMPLRTDYVVCESCKKEIEDIFKVDKLSTVTPLSAYDTIK